MRQVFCFILWTCVYNISLKMFKVMHSEEPLCLKVVWMSEILIFIQKCFGNEFVIYEVDPCWCVSRINILLSCISLIHLTMSVILIWYIKYTNRNLVQKYNEHFYMIHPPWQGEKCSRQGQKEKEGFSINYI